MENGKKLYFPTIIISDQHFGKSDSRADLLLEFLENVDCKKLIINGDFFDGWKFDKQDRWKLSELQMRVLDRINAMAARGAEITLLPGNHDEKLRGFWDPKDQISKKKDAEGRHRLLDRTYKFRDQNKKLIIPVRLTNAVEYVDPKGKEFLIVHGDQYDSKSLKTSWGQALSKATDEWYDALIRFDKATVKIRTLMGDFSTASFGKWFGKSLFSVQKAVRKAIIETAQKSKYHGLILGHLHHADLEENYKNSGDWMESNTALVHDDEGNWQIIEWEKKRKELGFEKPPTEQDKNNNKDFRNISEQQMRLLQKIWPGKIVRKALDKRNKARDKLEGLKDKTEKAKIKYEKAEKAYSALNMEMEPF